MFRTIKLFFVQWSPTNSPKALSNSKKARRRVISRGVSNLRETWDIFQLDDSGTLFSFSFFFNKKTKAYTIAG